MWVLGYGAGYLCEIWRNAATGFTNFDAGLPLLDESGSVGDYNHDGRLDVALSGDLPNTNAIQYGVVIWPSGQPITNTAPGAPSGLTSACTNGQATLRWNAATDAQTPSAGLSYNIRVGTQPGADNVVSPDANSDGFRLLPALGNAQMRTNALLNLPPGTYYWSVQAIDAAFAGGPFAPEASFIVPQPTLDIMQTKTDLIISWQPAYSGVVLQQSPRLNPATWIDSPSGITNPVILPATNTTMFYRLLKRELIGQTGMATNPVTCSESSNFFET